MKAFLIDSENNVIAYASEPEARSALAEGSIAFASHADLTLHATPWPTSRLVAIWNSRPGVVPVNKFTSRKTALLRVWTAIQTLQPPPPAPSKPADKAASPREGTKKSAVVALLQRPQGATVQEIMTAIGWQAHSVRGFLSTLKKRGSAVRSLQRLQGERAYALHPADSQARPEVR